MKKVVVGSRKSNLALTQTQWVIDKLKEKRPDVEFEVKHIVTKGDRILDVTLSKIGGKGLFVKEIEQALYDKEIDLAVHSMKDMPAELPEGFVIACVPNREDHRDVFISKDGKPFSELPKGALVGTSSLRRQSQVLAARPDLRVEPLRGNIDTRLQKLRDGQYDAIILAAAGLARMGWTKDIVSEFLPMDVSLSAVGQGALAIECRADDEELKELLSTIHDQTTDKTTQAERSFLGELGGSCQVPIAAHCVTQEDGLELTGLVATPDGKTVIKDSITGSDPIELGKELAGHLKDRGAKDILDAVKETLDEK